MSEENCPSYIGINKTLDNFMAICVKVFKEIAICDLDLHLLCFLKAESYLIRWNLVQAVWACT